MIDPDQLPDPKTAKVLERFDIAEPGDGIQELDGRRRETLGGLKPQKAASAFQCFAKEAAVAGQGSVPPPTKASLCTEVQQASEGSQRERGQGLQAARRLCSAQPLEGLHYKAVGSVSTRAAHS